MVTKQREVPELERKDDASDDKSRKDEVPLSTANKCCSRMAGLDNSLTGIETHPNTLRCQLVHNLMYDRLS
ncbi:hypothetical protein KIN20_004429 [Parelaphostrongylus tenuis]|uniref:Uncharacterized protein n=1 Tax=Parelaphostrongylus tenuis TaxID=148309 RepID=A0AAD5MRC8_PARTN|nr:hypothetical protein KIN20_004429 [Parelaphostrongylus tenuis]